MGIWIEGKSLAKEIKEEVRVEVERLRKLKGRVPGLIGLLVGENKESQVYLRGKEKTSHRLGIYSEIFSYPEETKASFLKEEIERLNQRDDVDGILVQLPLPTALDPHDIITTISPDKDVDGIHSYSLGNLFWNREGFKPCTPMGIMELLKTNKIEIAGKRVVIIGRSLIVGKPLAAMRTNANGTVTTCHSKTVDLPGVSSEADILVAAMGKGAYITSDFVKPGATVIDVGINHITDQSKVEEYFGKNEKRQKELIEKGYTLVGDVHPRVIEKAGFLTPVPGGVGPLTIAMLMRNTLEAFKKRENIEE